MRNDDMLLLEAQIVDRDKFSKEMLHQTARDEYNSDAFREFAQSALLQYTNLAVDFIDAKSHYVDAYDDDDNYFKDNYSKSGDPVLGDPVLTVDCYQINNTDTPMKIKAFPQRGEIPFEPGDKIRLYKSRKWTKQSLLKLAGLHRFGVLKGLDEESKRAEHMPEPSWKDNGTGFMTLLLRKQTE